MATGAVVPLPVMRAASRKHIWPVVASVVFLLATACETQPTDSVESFDSAADDASPSGGQGGGERPTAPGALQVVGSDPLLGRGMNSALAVHGDHLYVGSRTDGTHENAGVLVVDVSDPAAPRTVGEIGPPGAGNIGESSRELRVWTQRDVLITLNFACDPALHACSGQRVPTTFRFFDVSGDLAGSPRLLATHETIGSSHEFFLWADPQDPARALLYVSIVPGIAVLDISGVRNGQVEEVLTWNLPGGQADVGPGRRVEVHSVSVSPDGKRAYVSALTDGVAIVDTSNIAAGAADPQLEEITSPETRPTWDGPGAHSAIPIFGTDHLLTTDEVYGSGCPWAWARVIDARDESRPQVHAEYRVDPWNTSCLEALDNPDVDRDRHASFSSHNPTTTERVALVTWHAAGLQVIGLDDPSAPRQLAQFRPEPLDDVATEDPALTSGTEKIAVWSYPIIRDGLVYVVDVRNGLYVLRYRGPLEDELSNIHFLEGNSNLGDAVELAGSVSP